MATKNIVPRAAHEGTIGTAAKPFLKIIADEVDIGAVSVQTQLDDKQSLRKFSRFAAVDNDCLGATSLYGLTPLTGAAINSGTLNAGIFLTNHPGVFQLRSSTTPNSGYYIVGDPYGLICGGETFEVIFMVGTTAGTTIRMGWHNAYSVAAPVDGIYIKIAETTLTAVCMKNTSETDALDTVAITQGVWYRARIVVNADASLVTFTLVTCADGVPVAWVRNTIAGAGIPTWRNFGASMIATNSGSSIAYLLNLDRFTYDNSLVLVR